MLSHRVAAEDTLALPKRTQRIICVRGPLDWYTSLYNFKMAGGLDPAGKNYALMAENSLHDFLEDVAYLKNGGAALPRWNKPWEHRLHMHRMQDALASMPDRGAIGFWTLNILYYGCSRWRRILQARDVTSLILREGIGIIDIDVVLRMERLGEDANDKIPELVRHVDFSRRVNATPTDQAIASGISAAKSGISERDGAMARAIGYPI